ncbi:FtsW/RodA/SpoVE family cell cycle protein [Halobacillus sp. ACCC02827]|uniref:FtsW/RodA/SpoVE family cell cycle protein n=1 Tax=Bacillaceae TaxID=186817 RepID=UPI0002A5058A|nr:MULTISPECIES: FtsW/RodA/SpoVE family cell cycle protein [Bacillaceae]ELK47084.1 cell cycle protein FtsW [Halobacillus sp. BAB-2008]QHT47657.1 FtsW/RodA/SpoVE family cell cycle protein [Bacillus sp. SB49]WJE14895.1 FtsW/RodA/SpoVE family cell cycle protein [Halobacillus sp. ACCC02827]
MTRVESDFLHQVKGHIKNKEARELVGEELARHLETERERLVKEGIPHDHAEQQAVEQMGNPVSLGMDLNKLHRPKTDWWMVLLLGIAITLSFLPVFVYGIDQGYSTWNKVLYTTLGIAIMTALFFLDYRLLRKWGGLVYGFGVAGLFSLLVLPVSFVNGAPVLQAGPLSFKAFMFLPLLLVGFAAFFVKKSSNRWIGLAMIALPLFLYVMMPDIASLFLLLTAFIAMAWNANWHRRMIAGVLIGGSAVIVGGGVWVWKHMEVYQKERLLAFLHPEQFTEGSGAVYMGVRYMLLNGGWFGHRSEPDVLTSPYEDFMYASLVYHFGWITAFIVLFVLVLLIIRLVLVHLRVRDPFGKMLVTGGGVFFTVQTFYHILMIVGLLPITRISLPFFSYGFYPTVMSALVFGLVLSVYRKKDIIYVH